MLLTASIPLPRPSSDEHIARIRSRLGRIGAVKTISADRAKATLWIEFEGCYPAFVGVQRIVEDVVGRNVMHQHQYGHAPCSEMHIG